MANWFEKILPSFIKKGTTKKSSVPEGLWQTCSACNTILYVPELEASLYVCPKCDHHVRIGARKRLDLFLDTDNQIEIAADKSPTDWLKFKDTKRYKDRLIEAEENSEEQEALVVMQGSVLKLPLVAAAFEFRFMGGSMGAVVGQKFVEGVDHALKYQFPFVCFSTSGGARMQESLVSLYQMAKTSAALQKLKEEGLAREFINRIQSLRKDKGFEVTDKINILVEKNEALSSAIQNNFIYICDETLAEQLDFIDGLNHAEDKIELVDDISAKVSIKKQ